MFATVPASPFVDNTSTVNASTLNQWRAFFPQAVDGIRGGSYGLTAPLTFSAGGDTITFENPVRFDATGSVAIGAGVTATVEDNGIVTLAPGALLNVNGSFGNSGSIDINSLGLIQVNSGGTTVWRSGGGATWQSGSNLTINSGTNVTATVNGGTLTINGASTLTLTGSTFTHGNGAVMTHASGSAETHASGSNDTYQNGSSVTFNAGANVLSNAAVTINGAATLGSTLSVAGNTSIAGTLTRTGPEVISGTSAYTKLRAHHTASASGETIDISEYDMVEIPLNAITGTVNYTLTAPAGVRCRCQFYTTTATIADPSAVAVLKQGATPVGTISYNGTYAFGSVIITYDGTIMIPHAGKGASDGA